MPIRANNQNSERYKANEKSPKKDANHSYIYYMYMHKGRLYVRRSWIPPKKIKRIQIIILIVIIIIFLKENVVAVSVCLFVNHNLTAALTDSDHTSTC